MYTQFYITPYLQLYEGLLYQRAHLNATRMQINIAFIFNTSILQHINNNQGVNMKTITVEFKSNNGELVTKEVVTHGSVSKAVIAMKSRYRELTYVSHSLAKGTY